MLKARSSKKKKTRKLDEEGIESDRRGQVSLCVGKFQEPVLPILFPPLVPPVTGPASRTQESCQKGYFL